MLAKWRRRRLIVTILMAFIGALMVAGAWLSVGRVAGEAVVTLGFLGVILPIGFFVIATLVGWQRSVADGAAAPGGMIGFCLRYRVGMFAPLAFMFFLLGLMSNLNSALDRPAGAQAATMFDATAARRSCVMGATNSIRKNGGDPAAVQTRIDGFCGCVVVGMQTNFSDTELPALMENSDRSSDPRYTRVIKQCQDSIRS